MLIAARSSQDFALLRTRQLQAQALSADYRKRNPMESASAIQIGGTKPMTAMKNKE